MGAVYNAKNLLKAAVAEKDSLRDKVKKSFRKTAAMLKTNKNYTEAIGKALSIIGHEKEWDKITAQPRLEVSATGGQIRIDFKKGDSNGIHL